MADVALTTETMDAETLEALRGSIAKWQAIVDGTGTNGGALNCPLCVKFNSTIQPDSPEFAPCRCDGCPVHAATGKHGCKGSPYQFYEDAEDDDSVDEMEMRDLACDELNFLKSLLPDACPRCHGTKLVTIHVPGSDTVAAWDADDQPCPECSDETPPHVERAIASEGGQGG